MLRSIIILALVSLLIISSPLAALATGTLFLPAVGRNPTTVTQYGTIHGTAYCGNAGPATGAWLWLAGYSTVVNGDGSFVLIARAGTTAAIYYGQVAVSPVFTVASGPQSIGVVVLPC